MPPTPEPVKKEVKKPVKPASITSSQREGHDLLMDYVKRLGYRGTAKGTQSVFEKRTGEETPNENQLKLGDKAAYTNNDQVTAINSILNLSDAVVPPEDKKALKSYRQALNMHSIVAELNRNKAAATSAVTEPSANPSIGSKPVYSKTETTTTKHGVRPSGPLLRPEVPKSDPEFWPEPALQGPEEAPARVVTTTSPKILNYQPASREPTPGGVHLKDNATGDHLFFIAVGPNGKPLKALARTKSGALIKDAQGKPIFTEIRKPVVATLPDWEPVLKASGDTGEYQKAGKRKNGQPYDIMRLIETYGPNAEGQLKTNIANRVMGPGARYEIRSFPEQNPHHSQTLNELVPERGQSRVEQEGKHNLKLATDIAPFQSTGRPRPKQKISFKEELKRLDPKEIKAKSERTAEENVKGDLRNLFEAAPINEKGNKVGGSAVFTPVGSAILPDRGFKYDLPLSVEPIIYEGEHLFNHKYGKKATIEEVHQAYVKHEDPEAKQIGKVVQTLAAARGPNTDVGQVGLDRQLGMQGLPSAVDWNDPNQAGAQRAYRNDLNENKSQAEYLASQRSKAMEEASPGGTTRQGIANSNQYKFLTRVEKEYTKLATVSGLTTEQIAENLKKFRIGSNKIADDSGAGAPYSRTVPDIVRGGSIFKRNADNPNVRDEQGNVIKSHGRIASKRGKPEFAESGEVDEKTGERTTVYADAKAVVSKNISLVQEAINELKLSKFKGTPEYRAKEIEILDDGGTVERRRGRLPFGGASENTHTGSLYGKKPEKRGLLENQEAEVGKNIVKNVTEAVDKFIESKSPREKTIKVGPNGRKMWAPPTETQSGFRGGLTQAALHEFVINFAEKVSRRSQGNISPDRIIDVASQNPLVAEAIRWHAREHGSDRHTSIGGDRKNAQHREARNKDTDTREMERGLLNAGVKLEEIPKTPSKPFARKVLELMRQGTYNRERGLRTQDLRRVANGPIPVRETSTDFKPSALPTETERLKASEAEFLRRVESLFHEAMPSGEVQDYPRQRARKLESKPLPRGQIKVNTKKKKFGKKQLRGGISKSPLHFFSLNQNAPGSSPV